MLTVLTQNIWGGAPLWPLRRRALAGRIAGLRPDLVGLQEVHAPDPAGAASQAHQLADRVGGYRVVFAPGRVTPSGRCEGVAILSGHPILESETHLLTHDRDDRLERFGRRVVLRALVETPGGPLDLFVTHLSVSRRARARTVHELLAFTSRERAILVGDLNAEPDEPTIGVLRDGGWLDAWSASHDPGARGGTWPAVGPRRRIDYILARPAGAWVVHSCERVPPSGSDHLGVLARLG